MKIDGLISDLDVSPSPRHLTKLWSTRLTEHGFHPLTSGNQPSLDRGFYCRDGVLIAWRNMHEIGTAGARLLGAHTDSPGLHFKPSVDRTSTLHGLLSVEVYGSPILSSWFDRDLGIAGSVYLDDGNEILFHLARPIARLPHLAIHLDRELNERGHIVDRHRHLAPIWSVHPSSLAVLVASELGLDPGRIIAMSGLLVDTQPATLFGAANEFIASSRLDNQVSCWAAMHAILDESIDSPSMSVLYDHEEIGSASTDGAAGPLLERLLERISIAANLTRNDFFSFVDRSSMLSMDNSHALHPNHLERHDPDNAPVLGSGVAIKSNANQRYATSSRSLADVSLLAAKNGVSLQSFTSRNDVPCGSTIGPITATRLGISTVDVGVPQLAMHSVREMCHADDVTSLVRLATAYLRR